MTYCCDIVSEVAFPQRRQVCQSIRAQELNRIILAETDREQGRCRIGTHFTQVNRIPEHGPAILDRAKVGILGVSQLSVVLELVSNVIVFPALRGKAVFRVGGVVLRT